MASRSLGTLTVDLVAKIGGFVQGMDKAERESSKRARAIERQFKQIGAVVGAAFVGVTTLIIKNTIDAAREQAQLAAVLKSTGGAAGQSQAQLNDMADALQQVSTFAAGNITEMQSVLLTFTKIHGETFPKAQQAVLDMATALKMDLQSAAIQVGKALNDPILGVTALGRAGVQFSQDQKDLIRSLVETGEVAQAQTIILRELETQFGGSAEAASDTLGGALIILKNNFNDLLEGDSGGDGVRGTTQAVKDLAAVFKSPEVKEGFAALINGGFQAASAFAEMLAKVSALTKFLAEEVASNVAGPAGDDIGRLEQRADEIRKRIENQPSFVLIDIGGSKERRAELEKELDGIEQQIEFHHKNIAAIRARAAQEAEAVSTAAGTADPVTGRVSPDVQKTIDKLREEAEAYGLSKSALLEREKAKAISEATTQMEIDGLTESYDALIRLTKAQEQATTGKKAASIQAREDAKREKEELAAQKKLAEQVFEQRMELVKLAAEERQEREQALAAGRDLRDDLKFELKLMEMTNAERATAIQLRGLESEAVRKYGDEIAALNEQIEREIEVIDAMDGIRSETQGFFRDLIDGSKSAKEAFMDFVDGILAGIAEIAAKQLTEQFLGAFGTTQGGSAGDGWGALLGSLFGGTRASGGPVYPGKAYLVGEQGPELIRPMGAGMVVPAAQTAAAMGGGRGFTQINQFQLPGRYEQRTQAQFAADAGRASQRAIARSTAG